MTTSTNHEIAADDGEEDELLHDVWTYYYHDARNPDWNLESYARIGSVSSVRDFWAVHLSCQPALVDGMFFIMRESVFPCWDDRANIEGGCMSIKIARQDLAAFWELLAKRLLGETLVREGQAWDVVNGISVSPKRFFSIVKLWLAAGASTDARDYHLPPNADLTAIQYRCNAEHIKDNAAAQQQRGAPQK